MASLSPEEQLALINENLAEVMNPEIIEKIVLKERRPLKVYWGTAVTGRPHCAYFVPALKLAQLLKAGCAVTVLIADVHGLLDGNKSPPELIESRAKYYKLCVVNILKAVGVSLDQLKFTFGSSYQKSAEYIMDLYKVCAMTSEHDSKKAGSEVVKQSTNAPLSNLIYPLMQALDEQYLDVDAQFGGVDQRKIFALAKEVLPKLGYKERAHIMNPMVPGLQGGKMSASDPDSKIDLLDPPDIVTKKIKKAIAAPSIVEENGLLSFVEFVLLPAGELKYSRPEFRVDRSRDGKEPLVYTSIKAMQDDYRTDVLTPQLLKPAITEALNALLAPIHQAFEADAEWQDLVLKAYPTEQKVKKEKKVKNKGTGYPGAAAAAKNKEEQAGADDDGAKTATLPVREAATLPDVNQPPPGQPSSSS